jgi:hypothetical protein
MARSVGILKLFCPLFLIDSSTEKLDSEVSQLTPHKYNSFCVVHTPSYAATPNRIIQQCECVSCRQISLPKCIAIAIDSKLCMWQELDTILYHIIDLQ